MGNLEGKIEKQLEGEKIKETLENEIYRNRVYTTREAAKICCLSQLTIIRCFDKGYLKGFKVPGSKFRRIPHKYLVQFMKKYGMYDMLKDNFNEI